MKHYPTLLFSTLLPLVFCFFHQKAWGGNADPAKLPTWYNCWAVDAGDDVAICQGDTTQLGATGAASYIWLPAEGLSCTDCPNPLAFPDTTTAYVVLGNDGTQDTVVVTVSQPPQIIDVDFNHPTGCNLPNGTIVVTTQGSGPYEFSVNGGGAWQSGGIFTALAPGSYAIRARNPNGTCVVTGGNITLTEPPAPQIQAMLENDPTFCDVPNGSIVVSASGGISPLQYSINGGLTWQVLNTFQLLGSGNYQVRVRNANGSCEISGGTVTLTGSPDEAIISDIFLAAPTNCNEFNGLITVLVPNDNGNFEYTINGGINYQPGNSFTGLGEGIYHVLVRRTDGTCLTSGGYVELTSANHPVIFGVSAVNPQGCGGASGNINVLASGPSTLEFSIDGGTAWQFSNSFPNLSAGIYPVAVRNSDGTCLTFGEEVVLYEPAPPQITGVLTANPTACGSSNGSINISAVGNDQLEFSIDGGGSWSTTAGFNQLSEGNYEVEVRYVDGTCQVAYASNPVVLDAPGDPPVINSANAAQPTACGAGDGSLSLSASGAGALAYSIDGGATFQAGNNFTNLTAGDYPIVVAFAGTNCAATSAATLFYSGCTDTVQVTVTANTNTQFCIDATAFDNTGALTNADFCGQGNPVTVLAASISGACVNLVPATGFAGVSPDLICTVHCFDNNPFFCDTTYIRVTVEGQVNCDVFFGADTVEIDYVGDPTNYCVPVPLANLPGFDFFLDGVQFSNPFLCDYEPVTAYTYANLPGAGFGGPYSLDAWVVNGSPFSGFFNNANELLLLMNTLDPAGNWQISTQNGLIFGGDANSTYGNIEVTHLPSTTTTTLNPDPNFLPTGFTASMGTPGLHVLVVDNPFTGCTDTLYIQLLLDPVETDTIFLTTPANTPTGPYCLSGSELPGGVIVNVGYCGGPTNGVAPLASPTCVFYEPALNYAGPDSFCMIACDGGFPQTCDTTWFFIDVLPQTDTVYLTIPVGETSVDTCLSGFGIELPGPVTSAGFCAINSNEISGSVAANCLVINSNGTFFGTTGACVEFCSGGVCDQTIVIVTIVQPVICDEIFTQNNISVTSQADSNFLCIPIPPGEIGDYDVTVDGNLYTGSFMPCDFGNLAVYSYASLPAGAYFVESWTANGIGHFGNVPSFAALLDSLNAWDPAGDWVDNPLTLTFQGGQGGTYSNLVITPLGGAPQTLTLNLVQAAFGSQVTISGFGSHEIIVTATNGCADTVTFTLVEHLVTTEIFYFNTTPNNAVDAMCGNTFDLLGNLFSVSFCGLPANGAIGVVTPVCFNYAPNLDFVGSDTACIVLCDDSPVPVCDTFIFVINVADTLPPCPDIFPQDEVFISLQNGTGEVCLPVPVTQINDYQIFIDGVLYNNSLSVCDFDSVYIYFYGLVFGQGNSGPYSVSWQANGTTYTGVVQNMTELLVLMNGWDAAGNWQLEPVALIIASSNDAGVYGNLTLTHLGTGVVSQLAPDFNAVPLGTSVQVSGPGQQQIVLVSTVDGCSDTLLVTGLNGVDVLDILTVEEVPSDVECIDISGLPGIFTQLFICQAPQNGSLLISGNCFTFNPNPGFIGTNTGCLIACDNLGNCDTTLLNITVEPLCSLFDIFPDSVQQLQVTDCADISAYCVNVPLDSIGSYGVLDNGAPYTGGFDVCNGTLTQIVLDTGFHEIIFLHLNTGCMDTLLADVDCIPSDGCGSFAVSPLVLAVDDCAATAEFCVSVLLTDLPNFVVSDNGAAFGGTMAACGLNGITVALQLDTGLHQLVLEDTVKGCSDTFLVQVNCQFVQDVTVDVTVAQGDSLVLCLLDYNYPMADIDSLTVICTGDGNTTFAIDDQTWCITVFGETAGLDTLCFLVNVGDSSGIFTVNVTVVPPCPTYFPGGLLVGAVPCTADSGQICLPISFLDLANKTLTLDGQPYAGTLLPCGFDSLYVLNYNALPSAGLLGPYLIETWSINGGPPFTGVFNSIQELADSMNTWDPTGNWQVVFDPLNMLNLITGGNPLNTYSGMFIEEQLTGIEILLGIDLIAVPTGVAIEIPVGASQFTITDTVTLCTDTVMLELVCLTSDLVIDTILVNETDTFCLDLSELVGTVTSITNACPGSNGQVVAFTFENNCVIYTGNAPGLDSACVVVCDDAGLCDTTYFFITVTFTGDSLLVAVNDTIVTGQGQATTIAVLFNDTVQFLTDIYLVDPPANGDVVFLPDSSANYVPDPGYCDELVPDVFSYAICNPVGCDTATVYVTVLCAELEIFNAFSPNGDGTNDFFKINGLNDWPEHHLYVYNRWGNLVFEATTYQSDWSGVWKDKKLPDGTYFYVLDLGDGKKPLRGYVVILR